MKIVMLLMVFAMACVSASSGGGGGGEDCLTDQCICPANDACTHSCEPGATQCHVQGNSEPVDVTCADNLECHVECSASAACQVDCGGSAECHVTCPPSGCTVTNCIGAGCVVSCGFTGEATYSGGIATCP